jgi:hypothetical protein
MGFVEDPEQHPTDKSVALLFEAFLRHLLFGSRVLSPRDHRAQQARRNRKQNAGSMSRFGAVQIWGIDAGRGCSHGIASSTVSEHTYSLRSECALSR